MQTEATPTPTPTPKSSDAAVQLTNDEASISKRSAARAGYFDDEHLRAFVNKPVKRSALINRGYWIRVEAFRSTIK